ncbi:radical SAM protein [Clostridium sp.]|jgi:wyosine [tRNA(Phe)-imidazoG37] synthetase (radical SAM superfamily)|uniref:radical SAM protein n=1 Tax=Clostridium sp. TaxID=1506 RepID=UPI0025C2A043|nr:radical SAM protein [Clostridium sp.]MCI9069192.1 radical SAM protein [Clostridium sp.]
MNYFSYKDVYIENGNRVLEVNILPEKYCNFDCIFCPIGRSKNKVDSLVLFDDIEVNLNELENKIRETRAELIFINSKGEALVNSEIRKIIKFIKDKGLIVRLLSNGYLLGKDKYMEIANECDEVVGEIKVITEKDFQRVQRPIKGYTLYEYINNMVLFNSQYKGKFIFEITIIKGYNNDEKSLRELKDIINKINPNKVIVSKIEDEIFKKKLEISDEELQKISKELLNYN